MGIMRTLVVGCIGLAGLSAALNYGTGAWLRSQPTVQEVQTTGWPLHLGADMRGLSLPGVTLTGASVQAPLWDPLALQARITLPATVRGHILNGIISGPDVDADVAFGYDATLPVKALTMHLNQPEFALHMAPHLPLRADQADSTLHLQPDGSYAFTGQITNLSLPSGTAARLLPGSDLEDQIAAVSTQAQLNFLVPPSARGAAPQLDGLRLDQMTVDWGGRTLKASGALQSNPAGLAQGTLSLTTTDWEEWLAVARSTGMLGRADRMVEMVLRGLASGSTDNSVTVPINFTNGHMSIGPMPTDVVVRLR